MLDWLQKKTGNLAMRMSLFSGGFTRSERSLAVYLNSMAEIKRLRSEILPAIAIDILENRLLGRAFNVANPDDPKSTCEISFYTEGEDVLIRMRRPSEIYGLTLYWRGGPGLFFYAADMAEDDWPGDPYGHLNSIKPFIDLFCDSFTRQRGGVAGATLACEHDYFGGMADLSDAKSL